MPFVVDQEPGLKKALQNNFRNCPIMFCWNHLKGDFKFWFHGKVETDIRVYVDHLSKMLQSVSEEEFVELKAKLTSKWAPDVLEHFGKNISSAIQFHSGMWLIQKYPGMLNPYSGIANNLSESMNTVLKREQDWKELPVDLITLGLYYVQHVENYEILRGKSGIGNYHLKKKKNSGRHIFSVRCISPKTCMSR